MKGKHLLTLIAMCGLAGSSVGICGNTAGIFFAPIAADLNTGRGTVALTVTICSVIGAFCGLILPKILKEKNLKILIILATALLAGGTLANSLCAAVWQLYLLSVLRGIGAGITGFVLVTMILNGWFYARRGIITSIAMAFSGVPGVILSPVFNSIIQTGGWRQGYVAVSIAIVLFNLPAILFPLSLRPETQSLKPYGYEEFTKAKAEGRTQTVSTSEHEFNYADPVFHLALAFTILACVIAGIPQNLPGFAESVGMGASVGAVMLSFSMAFNIGSKLLFGVLSDKAGSLKTIILLACLSAAGLVILILGRTPLLMYAGSGMFSFTLAVSAVGIAMVAGDLFGMENYARVYPVMSLIGGIANALASSLIGTVYDVTGSYVPAFCAGIVMQGLVIFCLITAYRIVRSKQTA